MPPSSPSTTSPSSTSPISSPFRGQWETSGKKKFPRSSFESPSSSSSPHLGPGGSLMKSSNQEESQRRQQHQTPLRVVPTLRKRRRRFWVLSLLRGALKLTACMVKESLGFGLGLGLGLAAASAVLGLRRRLQVDTPKVRRIADVTDEAELRRLLYQVPEWVKNPTMERAGWVNAMLAKAWPHVSHVSSDIFRKALWPFIKEKFVECGMSVKLVSLSLGSFPPTLDAIKAVETLGDECILEASVCFASNSSLVCELSGFGGGFSTTVHLAEVYASATCRVTLAPLTAQFPCFAGVHVALMDMPSIDAKLTAFGGSDLFSVPRVFPFCLSLLRDACLAPLLLWPHRFLFPLQHEALEGSRRAVGTVSLSLLRARGLTYLGIGLPAPYVKVDFDSSRTARSTTKEGTINPKWNERLMLAVDDPSMDVLHFKVMDYDAVFRDSLLGTATLPISALQIGQAKRLNLNLQSKARLARPGSAGVLEIEALFRTFQRSSDPMDSSPVLSNVSLMDPQFPSDPSSGEGAGLLEVFVRKGVDLEPVRDGNASTFCKIFIGSDVRRTRVVQEMTNPHWDEEFEFLFDEPPLNSKLRIEVWNNDDVISLLSPAKRLLGFVEIKLREVVENQRIRDIFQLNQAKQGQLLLELIWLRH